MDLALERARPLSPRLGILERVQVLALGRRRLSDERKLKRVPDSHEGPFDEEDLGRREARVQCSVRSDPREEDRLLAERGT
jgi:hypothetical protein